MYDLMGYEGAQYVPTSGAFLELVDCVVKLCVGLVLVYSITLKGIVYLILVVPHDDMHLSLQSGGKTALTMASEEGHMECVLVLLENSADANMQNKVIGVIKHCVHAMQHVPIVPRHVHRNPIVCMHVHAMLSND